MFRLTRQTDLGIQLMTLIALAGASDGEERTSFTARELAERSRHPLPSVSKALKSLTRAQLLVSQRGSKGGYELARSPQEITVADLVTALEGPIALTECASDESSCDIESWCLVGANMRIINQVIHEALAGVSLVELASPGITVSQIGSGATTGLTR